MEGNIKGEERKVSTAKSEEQKDRNLKRVGNVSEGKFVLHTHWGLEVLLHSFLKRQQ